MKSKELNDVFSNLNVVLRFIHNTAVVNYTGERAFLLLKRVKNYLRSSISKKRLNALFLLNLENKLLNSKNVNDLINDFSSKRVRKKMF